MFGEPLSLRLSLQIQKRHRRVLDCSTLPVPSTECLKEGNGDLADIVTSPVRVGTYAYKLTVKSNENGSEPADCDLDGGNCSRRRTELQMAIQNVLPLDHPDAWPRRTERWITVSIYLDSINSVSGSSWGPIFFQAKPENQCGGVSPFFAIELNGAQEDNSESWKIHHRWAPEATTPACAADTDAERAMYYDKSYPRSNNWPDGVAHFPNESASKVALASINRGGWTDWMIHVNGDPRTVGEGGGGFLEVFKREDSGSWVEVVNITPGNTTRKGVNFDHGISYNGTTDDGFLFQNGMYMSISRHNNGTANWVVILDNTRFGDESCTDGACITHDGSSMP